MSIITTQHIIEQARTWLGVPFAHQGRTRHGVDCLGLLMGVAAELSLHDAHGNPFTVHDERSYSTSPCTDQLYAGLSRACIASDSTQPLQHADIGLFTIEGRAQHLGIVSVHPTHTLIHAYQPAGRVIEHHYDATWERRLHAVFRMDKAIPRAGS